MMFSFSRVPPSRRRAIINQWQGGVPEDAIAFTFGVSRSYVQKIARKFGLPHRKPRFDIETRVAIALAYASGEKIDSISARFKCSRTLPGIIARAAGIKRRCG